MAADCVFYLYSSFTLNDVMLFMNYRNFKPNRMIGCARDVYTFLFLSVFQFDFYELSYSDCKRFELLYKLIRSQRGVIFVL